MDISSILNPFSWPQAMADVQHRLEYKKALVKALTEALGPDRGGALDSPEVQLPDYSPDSMDAYHLAVINPVLRDVLDEHPEWCLLRWGSGASVQRTQDVIRNTPKSYLAQNIAAGVIVLHPRVRSEEGV